jgi:hypothetical protein
LGQLYSHGNYGLPPTSVLIRTNFGLTVAVNYFGLALGILQKISFKTSIYMFKQSFFTKKLHDKIKPIMMKMQISYPQSVNIVCTIKHLFYELVNNCKMYNMLPTLCLVSLLIYVITESSVR